jgi:hypothetical protein
VDGVALAKSKDEGVNDTEELLKASQELYELGVSDYGEENEYTITAGIGYAIDLQKLIVGGRHGILLQCC